MILSGLYLSIVSGLTFGMILSLMAGGLSLIYGVLNILDTAHGTFYMFGGFMAYIIGTVLRAGSGVMLPLSVGMIFVLGMVILVLVIPKNMRITENSDQMNVVMILLLGVATVGQYGVFIIFGGATVAVPALVTGATGLPGGIYLTNETLLAVGVTIVTYLALYMFLSRTRVGNGIMACTQNRELAEAIGIRSDRVALLAFGIGCAMSAMSGVLLGSLYSINSGTGWDEMIIAFIIVIFGGVGKLIGSVVGGLFYGVMYSIIEYYYPALSLVVVLLLIYAVVIIKPTGLFGEVVERV